MNLPDSTLYTYIDREVHHTLYFLEGQKLTADLITLHMLHPSVLNLFRSLLLSSVLMTAYLKKGERIGVYLDDPKSDIYLKAETGFEYPVRALVVPADAEIKGDRFTGILRLMKFAPHQHEPYQSIVKIDNLTPEEICSILPEKLYQFRARIYISPETDRAFMFARLPGSGRDETDADIAVAFSRMCKENEKFAMETINHAGEFEPQFFAARFAGKGFKALHARPVFTGCNCTSERVMVSLASIGKDELKTEFRHADPLVINCDFCKKEYRISEAEMTHFLEHIH